MKIKFIDLNKWLVEKVREAIPHFECINDDIFNHEWVIVSASNPNFTFGWWLDALIAKKYPIECKEKQSKKGWNERIGNIIFTITVDDSLKSNKVLIREALQSVMIYWRENETILLSWLGTAIGWLSEDDFIDVLKDFFPRIAYKWMDSDMKCKNIKFEIGKTYKEDNAKLCNIWFHYCQKLEDIYNYYPKDSRIFEIEILWQVDFWLDKDCSISIKILNEIDNYWIKKYKSKTNNGDRNNGNRNNGNRNNGNRNNGNRNNGDWNNGDQNNEDRNNGNRNNGSWNNGDWNNGNENNGDRNNGNRNNGDWNNGDRNNGNRNNGDRNNGNYFYWHFNIWEPQFLMFWKKARNENIIFPNYFYFELTKWIYPSDMTDLEKKDNPLFWITNWFLKIYSYKEAWKLSFDSASKKGIEQTIDLKNFNYKIFEQITGITKKMIQDRLK